MGSINSLECCLKYSKYLKGIDTIYVPVNSDLSTHKYTCNEEPCWRIKNNVINLKLKI